MEEHNKIYRKVGRRYEVIGYDYPRDWLSDGIWYVRTRKYSRGITNGDYLEGMFKICDKPLFDNFKDYCDLEDVVDTVMEDKAFRELTSKKEGCSLNDIMHTTIAILKQKALEQQSNEGSK